MLGLSFIGCTQQPPVVPTATATAPATIPTQSADSPERARSSTLEAQSISLGLEDVPGFVVVPQQNGPVDNLQAAQSRPDAKEHLRLLERWGRLGGYHSFFVPDGQADVHKSVRLVQSFVSVYKTTDGAKNYFEYATTNSQPQMSKFVVPNVGEQAAGFKLLGQADQTGYVFHFQRQNVVATVIIVGRESLTAEEMATFLARVMDKRILAARKATF